MFSEDGLFCMLTLPEFEGRKQRFARIKDLRREGWLKFLCTANARGCSVFMSVHPLRATRRREDAVVNKVDKIFLDLDSPESYRRFRADFIPALAVSTSPGRCQCFLRLTHEICKAEAKRITRALARKYGADIAATDLARLYRLPGFFNHKYSQKPLAKIVEFNPQCVYSSSELPYEKEEIPPKVKEPVKIQLSKGENLRYDYQHFLTKSPLKPNGKEPDYSQADCSYAIYLASCGLDNLEIDRKLRQESPDLEDRKKGNIEKYLQRTIEKARQWHRVNYKRQ